MCIWPGLDLHFEHLVESCTACQSVQSTPPKTAVNWNWPTMLWYPIHIDFAGPFPGNMYYIVVNAHSKWPEVVLHEVYNGIKDYY